MLKIRNPWVEWALKMICIWVLCFLNKICMGSIYTTNWLYKAPLTLKLRYVWMALTLKN
jgi:hypothetical protein